MSKQFAKFKINDLFEWDNGVRLNTNERMPGEVPFFTAGSENRGLYGYISNNLGSFHKPITIDMFGNCFYHPFEKCYGDDNVYFLERECSSRVKLYICAVISKSLQKLFSYATQFRKEQLRQLTVELPVTDASANTDTPEPDWEYMENYIKTIERKYIDQIAQVNAREQEILKQLYPEAVKVKPEAHGFEEFRVGDLFEIKGSKSTDAGTLHLTNDNSFPFIGRTSINNGIQGFCENLGFPANDAGEISISQVGTIDAQWRETPYYTSQNIVRCRAKDTTLTRRSGLYITAILKKHLSGFIGYTTPKVADIMDFEIKLPITNPTTKTPNPEPDWDYMEKYVAWIETQERESRKLRAAREEKILAWLHQQN